ncbi:MAG: sigma-70 family RNA polymerase sigma factor [Lentimicrobium sp.]|nr:sigma-70 family RNA polymerase sigma factor [Lentimicrobium sp.]
MAVQSYFTLTIFVRHIGMGNTAQGHIKLLDAFLTNKEVLLKEFYIAEYPKTKTYILKNGGSIDNANDIFQEAFFACWKKLSTGKSSPRNKAEIEAYLFTTAKNKWIDQMRFTSKKKTISIDEKIHHLATDEMPPITEINEKEAQLTITLAAFENLGQACKDLLTWFYFHKRSLRAIAEGLDMEEASVKNKKYRCIQQLKELALNQVIQK